MDSFLLMLSVALGALCTVLLLKIAFGEKREETDTAALEAAIRDALDRNSDAAEARQNRLEMRLTQANSLNREGMEAVRRESLDLIRKGSESQAARLTSMESSLAAGINAVNETVFQKLTALQAQNDVKLEQMRSTVEEKLQTTLQTRLSENFRLVATQLQALEEGLGEVKGLSENVDSLRRLMSNVKTRGTWGEAQLGAILSEILTPDQFGTNVETVPGTGKRVEFAVRMPGPDASTPVWLPIDSKFPREDWERLEAAREAGDRDAESSAQASLRTSVLAFAKDIAEKYLKAPYTTEFGIMYLPTESLYAEVLRIPGLFDELQQKWRVTPAGPTVISSLLNSLRMGFRTLAIQERSADVWKLLGRVKSEFQAFAAAMDAVDKRLRQAQEAVERVQKRTERVDRSLADIETLPSDDAFGDKSESSAGAIQASEAEPPRG